MKTVSMRITPEMVSEVKSLAACTQNLTVEVSDNGTYLTIISDGKRVSGPHYHHKGAISWIDGYLKGQALANQAAQQAIAKMRPKVEVMVEVMVVNTGQLFYASYRVGAGLREGMWKVIEHEGNPAFTISALLTLLYNLYGESGFTLVPAVKESK